MPLIPADVRAAPANGPAGVKYTNNPLAVITTPVITFQKLSPLITVLAMFMPIF
jgi:hypothetical protein